MLYFHDGPLRVWCKSLTALESKNLIPTVKFGNRILDEIMTKEVYLDILKN